MKRLYEDSLLSRIINFARAQLARVRFSDVNDCFQALLILFHFVSILRVRTQVGMPCSVVILGSGSGPIVDEILVS